MLSRRILKIVRILLIFLNTLRIGVYWIRWFFVEFSSWCRKWARKFLLTVTFCSHYEWVRFLWFFFCCRLCSFVFLLQSKYFFSTPNSFMHRSTHSSLQTKRFYFVSARKKTIFTAHSPGFGLLSLEHATLQKSLSTLAIFLLVAPSCIRSTDVVMCAQINVAQFRLGPWGGGINWRWPKGGGS